MSCSKRWDDVHAYPLQAERERREEERIRATYQLEKKQVMHLSICDTSLHSEILQVTQLRCYRMHTQRLTWRVHDADKGPAWLEAARGHIRGQRCQAGRSAQQGLPGSRGQ